MVTTRASMSDWNGHRRVDVACRGSRRTLAFATLLALGSTVSAACGGSSQNVASVAPAPASAAGSPSASSASAPSAAAPATSAPPAAQPTASASASAPEPEAPVDEADATQDLLEHHRHHHHGGVTRFILLSLDTLGVSPEQSAAVETIQSELRTKLEPARAADQVFMTLLADEVAAGSFNQAKIDAAIAAIAASTTRAQAGSEDALRELHAVLTPPQRAALADKIEAHWHVWEEANEAAEAPETDAGAAAAPAHESGALSHLATELSLTPDQREKASARLRSPANGANLKYNRKEVQARVDAFAASFSGDSFDAKALHAKGADTVDAHIAAGGAARMARFVEAVAPVLTPDQRAKLAQALREHATENGAGGA
jgi:Spy/CpxP family protein refolding chaperone